MALFNRVRPASPFIFNRWLRLHYDIGYFNFNKGYEYTLSFGRDINIFGQLE